MCVWGGGGGGGINEGRHHTIKFYSKVFVYNGQGFQASFPVCGQVFCSEKKREKSQITSRLAFDYQNI